MPLAPLKERKKELKKRKEDLGKKNDDGTIQIFVYRTILAFLGFANLLVQSVWMITVLEDA